MISTILAQAWRIFRERFLVIASVVAVIWSPCELLSSYFDAFVFAEDDFRKSFKFYQLLENFIGIIATIGVTFVALSAESGVDVGFGGAMGMGLRAWGRYFWTRLLFGLVILFSFLLLVLPGIYAYTRLCLVGTVVVAEGLSGTQALQRSFELTRGRFWQTFRLGVILILIMFVPAIFWRCQQCSSIRWIIG